MKLPKRAAWAAAVAAFPLAGCYVVPVGPDGHPAGYVPVHANPQAATASTAPKVLQARLYPVNETAAETGMVSGTVTNLGTGKGRLQLTYLGEQLTGEATRVSGDERKGVASAYGSNGAFMTCEYQMNSPSQGAGLCNFSNGARYQVHIGN